MKIIIPLLNRSSRKRLCAAVGCFALMCLLISVTVVAEEDAKPPAPNTPAPNTVEETQITENAEKPKADTTENTDTTSETPEKITGTAQKMERYDKEGITILIGEAKTVRYNAEDVEIGFLNADKITMKSDLETGTTTEIIAEGNVEIRDQDIFATCDHAIMDNLTNTITLKENVVVLQDKDRLETKLFTFNRTTGKQTGEGGVKFKVSVTQAAPVNTETDENTENSAETGEEKTDAAAPEKTGTQPGADKPGADKSEADKPEADKKDTDTEAEAADTEDATSEEKTDTDAENSDDADAETDEPESD